MLHIFLMHGEEVLDILIQPISSTNPHPTSFHLYHCQVYYRLHTCCIYGQMSLDCSAIEQYLLINNVNTTQVYHLLIEFFPNCLIQSYWKEGYPKASCITTME